MIDQASVKTPKVLKRHTTSEKNTLNSGVRKPDSYKDYGDHDHDHDHVPLSARLSRMSNLGNCSSKCVDDSVKKRPLANSNSLPLPVKKRPLASLYDDSDYDDIPISFKIKRSCKSADNSTPVMKKLIEKEHALVEKSIEGGQKKKRVQEQRLNPLKNDNDKCSKKFEGKKMQDHNKMLSEIEECAKDLVKKKAQLNLMEDLIGERKQELKTTEVELRRVNGKDRERKENELKTLSQKIAECNEELKNKEEELDAVKKLISGRAKELESERKKLLKVMSVRRTDPRAQMKDFESMKKQFEDRVKEIETNEMQFEGQMKELESKQKQLEIQVKEFESREEGFEGQIKELKSEMKHYESQLKERALKEKQLEHQVKEFESKKEELEGQKKELESQKKLFESLMKELKSKEKQFEERVKSNEKLLDGRSKEFESKHEELEGRVKEFELKNKHFESRLKEFESKEKQLEGRLKEFESKEEELNGQVKVFISERKHYKSQVKKLKTKKKQFTGRVRELESKERLLEGRVKEFQLREEIFEGRVREIKLAMKHFVIRLEEDFKSEEEQFEGLGKDFESKENKFEAQAMELISKENQFEGQVKDLESKPNKFDGHPKDFEFREKQYEVFLKSLEQDKDSGNQSSPTPTINGRDLQSLPSDQMEKIEPLGNDIVVELLASSDPSKDVLDILLNPIIPQCRKGDSGVNIVDSHIVVLEQLMRISPAIKPHVKEEALKLALDLKANMSEDTEDSVVALGFLLLVSIYGLVSFFDKDEVFELLGFAAQHKIAVELFGTLGFADKISDFVEILIRKQQHIVAVRFICAYNLADKCQPVDLLREHIENAKLICDDRCCKETSCIKIKDKARDQEIASLRTVLQCIADNNIESEDLDNEIRDRILELNVQKGK